MTLRGLYECFQLPARGARIEERVQTLELPGSDSGEEWRAAMPAALLRATATQRGHERPDVSFGPASSCQELSMQKSQKRAILRKGQIHFWHSGDCRKTGSSSSSSSASSCRACAADTYCTASDDVRDDMESDFCPLPE
jgi:hypothetical protein